MPTPDETGFTAFVHARRRALEQSAWLLTGDRHLAEDLVQTALLQAARNWERIHTSAEAYVRRTLYTTAVSGWRRRRVPEVALAGHDAAAPGHDADLTMVLMEALGRITPKQRAVLVLRYFEDLTETQTAEALGIAVGTVKSTHRQALARLRHLAPDLAEHLGLPSLVGNGSETS